MSTTLSKSDKIYSPKHTHAVPLCTPSSSTLIHEFATGDSTSTAISDIKNNEVFSKQTHQQFNKCKQYTILLCSLCCCLSLNFKFSIVELYMHSPVGRDMVQMVSRRLLSVEATARFQANPRGKLDNDIGSYPSTCRIPLPLSFHKRHISIAFITIVITSRQ